MTGSAGSGAWRLPREAYAAPASAVPALRQRCDTLARQLARCASADERHALLLQLASCGLDLRAGLAAPALP